MLLLMVLDGWGINPTGVGDAIKKAKTPFFDRLNVENPSIQLKASGLDVGLPDGQMGNSEVGHLNLGAGRVVMQDLPRISNSIDDKSFFQNPVLCNAISNAKKNNSSLHLLGLLSDGGVHSHIDHLFALLDMAKQQGVTGVYVHAFLDGRDVSPDSAGSYIDRLSAKMTSIGCGKISTIMGRYYGMDRDNRWDRVELAYNAMVCGEGDIIHDPREVVKKTYSMGIFDEFVMPAVIDPEDKDSLIKDEDSVVFFNFRADRVRQIARSLFNKGFSSFARKKKVTPHITCFTEYDKTFPFPVAFDSSAPRESLGEVISKEGLKQLRIAESEKYAHVTFFFNGGIERSYNGEDRILVPSPDVATYDKKPEMSAYEVAEKVKEAIASKKYDFILLNFANADMVGHTGFMDAAVKAVEAVDSCVEKVVNSMKAAGGDILITADHGNIEEMIKAGSDAPATYHTTNVVPFYCILDKKGTKLSGKGILADVAPTVLKLMNIPVPSRMTGKSLI